MTERPGFSVVIPIYNKVEVLSRAIESVLKQRDVDVQIICVDDGSTDGSVAALTPFGSKLELIRQENQGPSAARNRALDRATHDWIAFLDADDIWDPDYLAAVGVIRARHQDLDFIVGSYRIVKNGTSTDFDLSKLRLPLRDGGDATTTASAVLARGMASGAISCRRSRLLSLGGFDSELRRWEIADLIFRLLVAAGPCGVIADPRVEIHRDAGNSQWLREKGNTAAQARLAHRHLDAVLEAKLPQDTELSRHAYDVALRTVSQLLRTGERDGADQLRARVPSEGNTLRRCRIAVERLLPTFLVRHLHR